VGSFVASLLSGPEVFYDRRMGTARWLGVMALLGSFGCGGNTGSTAGDGGGRGQDGSGSGDAPSSSDGAGAGDSGGADTGATDAGCVTGMVSFEIQAAAGATMGYCLGAPGACSSNWLSIRPADGGAELGIDMPCETMCNAACQPIACTDQCAVPSRLGDGGAQTTWDGTEFFSSTCGAGIPCVNQACAPAGSYVASFCVYAAAADSGAFDCMGSSTPTCTDVPFAWPPAAGSGPVLGVIGGAPGDGG